MGSRSKGRNVVVIFLFMVFLATSGAQAATKNGTLTITGVPLEQVSGNYNPDAGVFKADVSEFLEALISVKFEDLDLLGQKMEWRTKDNYLIFEIKAKLDKPDEFSLTADIIEYFGDEERLKAAGNVVVVTEDTTVYADHLIYDEKTDEAIFQGQVRVIFSEGTLEGEKFKMFLEKGELQFFGAFQGEFSTDSNN